MSKVTIGTIARGDVPGLKLELFKFQGDFFTVTNIDTTPWIGAIHLGGRDYECSAIGITIEDTEIECSDTDFVVEVKEVNEVNEESPTYLYVGVVK